MPVDLDEILPASKQKKLVLPSVTTAQEEEEARVADQGQQTKAQSEGKQSKDDNNSSTSRKSGDKAVAAGATASSSSLTTITPQQPSSSQSTSTGSNSWNERQSTRRGGPGPPPGLDLLAARRLCETTDAALDGLTDEELNGHIKQLLGVKERANLVLDYWAKRHDELVGEKEAFEGVIENLVSHVRRVRK